MKIPKIPTKLPPGFNNPLNLAILGMAAAGFILAGRLINEILKLDEPPKKKKKNGKDNKKN